MSDALIAMEDVNFKLVRHEELPRLSLYLKAGAPLCCQNLHCKKPFDGFCIRGDDDQFYCSELCAQVGLEVDLDVVANRRRG